MIIHDANGQPYDADLVPGVQYRELVAALRSHPPLRVDFDSQIGRWMMEASIVLARAESGTPGKHPDTVRLDWMLQSPFTAHGQCCNRDDIDAAMMGGAK